MILDFRCFEKKYILVLLSSSNFNPRSPNRNIFSQWCMLLLKTVNQEKRNYALTFFE